MANKMIDDIVLPNAVAVEPNIAVPSQRASNHNEKQKTPTRPSSGDGIYDKLCDIIVDQLGVQYDEIYRDSNFIDDLGADSLDGVELIMAVEEEFDIEIPDEDVEELNSVQDVVDFIKRKMW